MSQVWCDMSDMLQVPVESACGPILDYASDVSRPGTEETWGESGALQAQFPAEANQRDTL